MTGRRCFFCGPIEEGDILEHQATESHHDMVALVNDLDGRVYWPPGAVVLTETE